MPTTRVTASNFDPFKGPGEMRELCRAFDWASTPLGSTDTWSHSLRTTVANLLASRHPKFLFWGPDLVQIYNDSYRPSFGEGGRHPRALGARGAGFWTEIWDIIGPQIDQVMGGGGATWHEDQLVPIERNGRIEEVYWTYSYGPAFDDDGSVGGVLVVCQETTGRVLTGRRLEAVNQELEAANRAKAEFLAVMSHELRTPLNAIAGYADLLELGVHGPLNDDQLEAIRRISKSQHHLLGLVNGVLNYIRVETGKVEYELSDVSVREALSTCEALIVPQARARGLALRFPTVEVELTVRADDEKLQQVLLNLLSNAVKFTEAAGNVEVSCEVEPNAVLITVRDTGRGIAISEQERIFEPFVQIDARLTRTQDGTGLGLAISRDLARGMQGDITVESTPSSGSTFTLRLPRAPGLPRAD